MEINIGISECNKNVDNYYGRNIGSHTAPAERLSTVSNPLMVLYSDSDYISGFFVETVVLIGLKNSPNTCDSPGK